RTRHAACRRSLRGTAPSGAAQGQWQWSSDVLTGPPGNADLVAVVVEAVADAGGDLLAVLLDDQHHVADVDRGLRGDDAAGLRSALRLARLDVLLDPVDTLDDDTLLAGESL